MTDEGWDFEHQRAETEWTVRDLLGRTPLKGGERIALDLVFVPGADGDRAALVRKFGMFGYHVRDTNPDEPEAVTVQVADVSFDAADIWRHEMTTTKLALIHGYLPDGWGFEEP